MSFIYIGSPYSSPDQEEMLERFHLVEVYTAYMLLNGEHVYSPIVHCHELAGKYKLPKSFPFWKSYNYAMLCKASKLHVLTIPGWAESQGLSDPREGEIALANSLSIGIEYILPSDLAKVMEIMHAPSFN